MFVKKRRDEMIKYCHGKVVLNIGCCGNYNDIHVKICEESKECTGIDINKEVLEKLRQMGYNVVYADAQDFDLNKKYDVIVCGEVMEHLPNLDGFFKSVKKHLKDDGIFVLTVPNAFSLMSFFHNIYPKYAWNQHYHLFCGKTLRNLLEAYGFKVVKMYLTDDPKIYKNKVVSMILSFIRFFVFKLKVSGNYVVVCKHAEHVNGKVL